MENSKIPCTVLATILVLLYYSLYLREYEPLVLEIVNES
jgi:hypothetical protein